MNATPTAWAVRRLPRPALLALVALLTVFCASVVLAAPPPGKGGGKGKGGGGDGGGTSGGYQPEVRFQCRAPLDGIYSRVRPAVASDGTVYVVDTSKTLYAFDPAYCIPRSNPYEDPISEWPPKWTVPDAGSKGVDVGPDGTIYTGTEAWIKAFNPDGSPKWTFTQDPRAFILIDVAVGPDDNIYGVASSGMGVFALDPDGNELWRTAETYGRPLVSYTEIAFNNFQLGFAANGHFRVVETSDGGGGFILGGGLNTPKANPWDDSWHVTNRSHTSDGTLIWEFDSGEIEAFSNPALGSDGTHYTHGQFGNAYAIDSTGTEVWRTALEEFGGEIDVDPTNSIVVLSAGVSANQPAALQALNASNGRALWRMEFPAEPRGRNQYVDTNAAFTDTGDTAYVITAVASTDRTLPRTFLNAVATDPSLPAASTLLRVADITMDSRSRRRAVTFNATVTVLDENRAAISGATVSASWTLPDAEGTVVTQTADTGGGGRASFSISGAGGVYRFRVTEISKPPYIFDRDHSLLDGVVVGF